MFYFVLYVLKRRLQYVNVNTYVSKFSKYNAFQFPVELHLGFCG